jgi:hypothetical protein
MGAAWNRRTGTGDASSRHYHYKGRMALAIRIIVMGANEAET